MKQSNTVYETNQKKNLCDGYKGDELLASGTDEDLEKRKDELVECLSEGNQDNPNSPFKIRKRDDALTVKKRQLAQVQSQLSQQEKEQMVLMYWKKVCSIDSKAELIDKAFEWMKDFDEEVENPGLSSPAFALYSSHEFDYGDILAKGFNDQYKPLVKNLSLEIQTEYNCFGASEKALAELMAQSFCKALDMQYSCNELYNATRMNEFSLKRQQILSKEMDRAYRQYLSCLQAMRSIKQPALNVTIKTQTANIAHQQVVQENNNA
jgi:hypothetical protein